MSFLASAKTGMARRDFSSACSINPLRTSSRHVRVVKLPSGKFGMQIAESYRKCSQVCKRILLHIGSAAQGNELELMRRSVIVGLEHMRSTDQGNIFPDATMADLEIKTRERLLRKMQGEMQNPSRANSSIHLELTGNRRSRDDRPNALAQPFVVAPLTFIIYRGGVLCCGICFL